MSGWHQNQYKQKKTKKKKEIDIRNLVSLFVIIYCYYLLLLFIVIICCFSGLTQFAIFREITTGNEFYLISILINIWTDNLFLIKWFCETGNITQKNLIIEINIKRYSVTRI